MNLSVTGNLFQTRNINNNNNNNNNTNKINIIPFFTKPAQNTYNNLAPLARDTVSFGTNAGNKIFKYAGKIFEETAMGCTPGLREDKITEHFINDFTRKLASEINADAQEPMQTLKKLMVRYFRKDISEDMGSDKPIQKLDFRVKTSMSIHEKLNSVGYNKKKKAEENDETLFFNGKKEASVLIKDLLGTRIIMRDASKESVGKVIKTLGQMVTDGKIKVTEIESYRPSITAIPAEIKKQYREDLNIRLDEKKEKAITRPGYFAYANDKDLNAFEETCRKFYPDLKVESGKSLPNGYQAIHVNFIMPDGTLGEIQILGRDVAELKELEDAVYKKKCNKTVKNELLNERLEPLTDSSQKAFRALYDEYTKWAYIGQRLLDKDSYNSEFPGRFLSGPKEIKTKGMDYNQLWSLKQKGQGKAKKSKTMDEPNLFNQPASTINKQLPAGTPASAPAPSAPAGNVNENYTNSLFPDLK